MSEHIFHIALGADWQAAQAKGVYRISTRDRTLEEVGFIHCSYASQVPQVARSFYQGVQNLVLLEIDRDLVHSQVVDESAGGEEKFPHIYGPLNLEAVVQVQPFKNP
jgi:glutathione S-transferase